MQPIQLFCSQISFFKYCRSIGCAHSFRKLKGIEKKKKKTKEKTLRMQCYETFFIFPKKIYQVFIIMKRRVPFERKMYKRNCLLLPVHQSQFKYVNKQRENYIIKKLDEKWTFSFTELPSLVLHLFKKCFCMSSSPANISSAGPYPPMLLSIEVYNCINKDSF